ncbi:DUF885 domain-containing protein [Kineothrix sedimenti]|uniref:DUF885 domain-containing protein n=1 Tax=Kineothrix sedimenti TaxID=3123317 RepID=A0ABZ3EVX1_9FIRM
MKKFMNLHLSNKRKAAIFSSFALLLLAGSFSFFSTKDSRSFQNFAKDFFVSELTANTLNMHYTVATPSSFGIDSYESVLPFYSKEDKEASLQEIVTSLERLYSLDDSKLNEQDAYTYRLLVPYLENEKTGISLYYYSAPLSPSSGMQSQLPILLAEYAFRNKRDVDDYLALLDQTDTYFEGIAQYLKEQSAEGLFMPDYSVDKVIEQCDTIMDESSLSQGTHFLNTTFEERLDSLLSSGIISEEEKQYYISQNNRLLTTVMLPAYQKLGDELILLRGSGKNENGLYYYPGGREYYKYILRSHTASYRDIDSIKALLFQDFNDNFDSMYGLLQSKPSILTAQETSSVSFRFEEPSDMLKSLQQMMQEDFPALSEASQGGELPICTIKSISKNLEEYSSPAFYLTPPLDDIRENVIYINQKNNDGGVELYTTLAHEGYPGHLYQTVYSQLYFNKTDVNPIRSLLSYSGYAEGWAMYVELMAYDYAKALMKDTNPGAEGLYESYKLDRQIQLCLYSLLDIAIHYEGANYKQVHKILSTIGISNVATTRAIYEYIVEEPGTYLKYYLGYLEVLELKKEAQRLWGNDYSEYRFHKFYLENGPADFTNLKLQLEKNKDTKKS